MSLLSGYALDASDRLGLDLERLQYDMLSPEIAAVIRQELADADTLKLMKIPDFFVNGKPLPSFGFEQLQALVQEELASAYRQQESLRRRISSRFLPPTFFQS